MQATILDINENSLDKFPGADVRLTFVNFIKHLQKRIEKEEPEPIKKMLLNYAYENMAHKDVLSGYLGIDEVVHYKTELSLIYNLLMPAIAGENNLLWALSLPLSSSVFYGTDAFYDLLRENRREKNDGDTIGDTEWEEHKKQKQQLVYTLILQKIYKYALNTNSQMVHSRLDKKTGLRCYYRVELDASYVEVYAKEKIPEITCEAIGKMYHTDGQFDWESLFLILPLTYFRFEGFSIITLTDITVEQTLGNIKEMLVNQPDYDSEEYYERIMNSLQALCANSKVFFDLLPTLRINKQLAFHDEVTERSMLVKAMIRSGKTESEFAAMAEIYLQDPRAIFLDELTEVTGPDNLLANSLLPEGIIAYALIPVYYNHKVVGLLEAYSKEKNELTAALITRVETATPLLSQLLQKNITEFEAQIAGVISTRFTSLQPAVQWKFNEVAFHYLNKNKHGKTFVEDILFKDVFPLYGAIDIRNSTIVRNQALVADLHVQLDLLISLLEQTRLEEKIALVDEFVFKSTQWKTQLQEGANDEGNIRIRDFLDNEVSEFLEHFAKVKPLIASPIYDYFLKVNPETGIAYSNRRSVEQSMRSINNAINQYLELFKDEIQSTYPCYFEKFRTDGVEFDIYIGQSISPGKPFDSIFLKNIRLSQVTAMAAIAKITHALLPMLETKLSTTQLIFIHSRSINISFRNDERRFDVEGAYNIRYQVIKKRIDKVNIRQSGERLTQPGKLAFVYFSAREMEEYMGYISYLQGRSILKYDTEVLELEDLQGVSGLKAIRVGIVMDDD